MAVTTTKGMVRVKTTRAIVGRAAVAFLLFLLVGTCILETASARSVWGNGEDGKGL